MARHLLNVPSRLQILSAKLELDRDIQRKIKNITSRTETAAKSFQCAIDKEGRKVLLQKTLLMTAVDDISVSDVQSALYAATEAFSATRQLVVWLQMDIHGSIELCRRRKVSNESELEDISQRISNMRSEITSLEETITTPEQEATALQNVMTEAVKLSKMAEDVKKAALRKAKDAEMAGMLGRMAAAALAPFTGGESMALATAASNINAKVNVTSAIACEEIVTRLRIDADRKNKKTEELKSQKATLGQQISIIESDMGPVQSKTERLTEAANVLQQVASFLLPTTNAIDVLVQAIQDMDAALKEVALQDNSFEIIRNAFTNQTEVSNGSSKNDIDKLKEKWEELEGILLQNGAQNTDI